MKWQGIVRERFFLETVATWGQITQLVLENKLNMITAEEHSYFIRHAFFGDHIKIYLLTTNIKKFSFDMVYIMFNQNNDLLYEGFQRLAFDDFKGKFLPIPSDMLVSIKKREANLIKVKFSKLKLFL